MKTPARSNRSSNVEYKSPKRKKPATQAAPIKYCDRFITWEEQKQLGPEFVDVGEGFWPIGNILKERTNRGKTEYLIEWKALPSGERFRPEWVWYTWCDCPRSG